MRADARARGDHGRPRTREHPPGPGERRRRAAAARGGAPRRCCRRTRRTAQLVALARRRRAGACARRRSSGWPALADATRRRCALVARRSPTARTPAAATPRSRRSCAAAPPRCRRCSRPRTSADLDVRKQAVDALAGDRRADAAPSSAWPSCSTTPTRTCARAAADALGAIGARAAGARCCARVAARPTASRSSGSPRCARWRGWRLGLGRGARARARRPAAARPRAIVLLGCERRPRRAWRRCSKGLCSDLARRRARRRWRRSCGARAWPRAGEDQLLGERAARDGVADAPRSCPTRSRAWRRRRLPTRLTLVQFLGWLVRARLRGAAARAPARDEALSRGRARTRWRVRQRRRGERRRGVGELSTPTSACCACELFGRRASAAGEALLRGALDARRSGAARAAAARARGARRDPEALQALVGCFAWPRPRRGGGGRGSRGPRRADHRDPVAARRRGAALATAWRLCSKRQIDGAPGGVPAARPRGSSAALGGAGLGSARAAALRSERRRCAARRSKALARVAPRPLRAAALRARRRGAAVRIAAAAALGARPATRARFDDLASLLDDSEPRVVRRGAALLAAGPRATSATEARERALSLLSRAAPHEGGPSRWRRSRRSRAIGGPRALSIARAAALGGADPSSPGRGRVRRRARRPRRDSSS